MVKSFGVVDPNKYTQDAEKHYSENYGGQNND
jgi:hypothetical protein